MLKNLKPPEMFNYYKVVRPSVTPKGSVRFNTKSIKVHKEENEAAKLGL